MKKIFVVLEGETGERLLAAAGALAESLGAAAEAVVFGERDPARCFAAGARHVYLVAGAEDEMAKALSLRALVLREKPEIVLLPSTLEFRTAAPMAAAMLETGLTADCTGLSLTDDGLLRQTRPALGGSVSADILCAAARPQMATVQENALPPAVPRPVRDGTVSRETCPAAPAIRLLSALPRENRGLSLREAKVILSGGKGVGSREGFEKLRKLAERIPGAVVGASRGAVSANLAPYECQVGLTGEFVRPPLYIAFGISGAVQHLVGMRNSGTIIAVNTDKDAPIFDYSDVAIVAPWESVAEELLLALQTDTSC
ncbi:MAG: electron transfer flavoprotein subunit alpha/FixB family protein [Oscillospiraceae bacterium]|nr:electron transfer flavoprotein subunit alpha/FixB family protein [Oscillospiraceae bacterium]